MGSGAARGSRAAAARSTLGGGAVQAGSPYLLGGPLPRPVGGHVGVVLVGFGVGGRLDLDQVEDLEAVRTQQPDPVAVREVVLDALVRPRKAVHPELRTLQCLHRGDVFVGRAEDDERRVAEEYELAGRTQQTSRLRDPAIRVGPDRRAVLRDDEVEGRVRKRHVLSERFHELEPEAETLLTATRRLELSGSRVDAENPRGACLLQPGAEVRSAATELE